MIKELAKGTAEPLVLQILAGSSLHGYGILQAIKERSEGVLEFTEGTVYPLLHALEQEGLLSSVWEALPSGRRRKVYCITPAGQRRLAESREQWRRFRLAIDNIFGLREGVEAGG
ncbi:MAG: PadR family transcriptional regulator [Bacillota bacterium]